MIRLVARFTLATDDMAAVDGFGDHLMDALRLDQEVLEPDLAISMTERTLEIHLLVDTRDGLEAVERGHRSIRQAFVAAGNGAPSTTTVLLHEQLISPEAALRTELVGA